MDSVQAMLPGESPFNVRAHRHRGWNVRRRTRGEPAAASSEARGKNVITPPPPLMHVMKYMVPSVLVFATLRHQGKPQALLQENPAAMWCFVAAACVYWLIAGEMKRTPPARGGGARFRIYGGAALASGILSGAIVVSMLLPRPAPIWIALSAGLMLYAAFSLIIKGIRYAGGRVRVMEAPPSSLPV